MKYSSLIVLGAVLAATSSAAAQSDFKAAMQAMIPKVEKAFETKNMAYFEAIAAPDFVDKSMGQTLNRKQAMAEMKMQVNMTQSMKMHMKLVSAQASGSTGHAVLTGSASFTMKPGKDGKAHTMTTQFTEHQTWVRSGSGWKLKVLDEAMSNTKMDGKAMPKGAGG
jgi:hypothetical protein